MPIRLRTSLLAAGCLWLVTAAGQSQQNPTTVPVFLPGYGDGEWLALRGSVIAIDNGATRYTIFCAWQTPQACVLDMDLPFSFAEGPGTLRYDGTISGQITAHLSCNLAGTTAATCTGSTSYGAGITEGPVTGPTQTSWSKTLTGKEVVWGVLTLTTPPATLATTDLEDPSPPPTQVDSSTGGSGSAKPTSVGSGGIRSLTRNDGLRWSLFVASLAWVSLLV